MTLLSGARTVMRSRIAQNAAALFASQFLLAVLPLITLPWLARVLGASELGEVLYVQSFAFLLAILGEYGFRLSATRSIARVRDDRERLAGTVAGVMGAKLILIGGVTALSVLALALIPRFREEPVLLLFGWAMAVVQGFDPLWFFAGVERLRLTAGMEASSRLLTAVAIIALVREEGQGVLVLAIWTAGLGLSTGVLTILMYRQVPLRPPRLRGSLTTLREGWSLFANTAAVSMYTTGTLFLLGFVVSNAQLAIFGSAERIVRAALRGLSPIGAAVYPRVAYLLEAGRADRAQRLSSLALGALFGIGLLMALALILLAPLIVDALFGPGFEATVTVLRILALLLPLIAIGSTLSALWLLPRGLDRLALWIVVVAGLANAALAPAVGAVWGVEGAAWVLVGIESGVAVGVAVILRQRGLVPTRAQVMGRT
jgi:PST family polysaccharide transporter